MARPAPALAFQDDTALQTPGPVRDRLIAQMRRQGARNVRINAIYGRIKAQGYGALDDEINALRAAGIRPQVTIMGTPGYADAAWSRDLSNVHPNARVMQQFAREVAGHFKGRVGRYSIGNEPNLDTFQQGSQANAKAGGRVYRGVYRGGYAGVKAVDPTAEIMLGELAPHNARAFLAGVLGGKPLRTSGLALHPYDSPEERAGGWDITNLPDLQRTLARYKQLGRLQTAKGSAAPLYLTEFGYQKGSMPDPDRMRLLAAAYAKAKAAGARQLLQYQLMPTPPKTTTTPGDPITDAYGSFAGWGPGRSQQAARFVWDTGIADASGRIPVINRAARLAKRPVARATKARRKR